MSSSIVQIAMNKTRTIRRTRSQDIGKKSPTALTLSTKNTPIARTKEMRSCTLAGQSEPPKKQSQNQNFVHVPPLEGTPLEPPPLLTAPGGGSRSSSPNTRGSTSTVVPRSSANTAPSSRIDPVPSSPPSEKRCASVRRCALSTELPRDRLVGEGVVERELKRVACVVDDNASRAADGRDRSRPRRCWEDVPGDRQDIFWAGECNIITIRHFLLSRELKRAHLTW